MVVLISGGTGLWMCSLYSVRPGVGWPRDDPVGRGGAELCHQPIEQTQMMLSRSALAHHAVDRRWRQVFRPGFYLAETEPGPTTWETRRDRSLRARSSSEHGGATHAGPVSTVIDRDGHRWRRSCMSVPWQGSQRRELREVVDGFPWGWVASSAG